MNAKNARRLVIIAPFAVLVFWLFGLFAVLYFERNELLAAIIVAFFVLNLGIGLCINKFAKPVKKNSYRHYLRLQTFFLLMWCPVLGLVFHFGRKDLLPMWVAVLLGFYIIIGCVSGRQVIKNRGK